MPGSYEIRYDDGRVEGIFGIRGLYYEFSNGDTLDVDAAIGWCHSCDAFTDVESLKPIAEIDKEIAAMGDPSSDIYRLFFDSPAGNDGQFLNSLIADAKRRREFLLERRSPAKCLHCGTVNILQLPHGESISHPRGTGTFIIELVGMCSTDFMNWYFTPDGDRIPRDTKPSYWHFPGLDRDRTMR